MNKFAQHYFSHFKRAAEEAAAKPAASTTEKPEAAAAPAPAPPPIKPIGPQHPPMLLNAQGLKAKFNALTPVPILQRNVPKMPPMAGGPIQRA
jgi:hypothetical protein